MCKAKEASSNRKMGVQIFADISPATAQKPHSFKPLLLPLREIDIVGPFLFV